MKKIILSLVVLVSMQATAQDNYMGAAAGLDVRNAVAGSNLGTGNSLDGLLQFIMVSNDLEVNVGYEFNPKLDFSKFTFGVGYHLPLYAYVGGNEIKTTFIPTIEPTLIDRTGNWGGGLGKDTQNSSHLSVGLTLSLNWRLNDYLDLQYSFNALPRTDLKAMYPSEFFKEKMSIEGVPIVGSNFIKIVYRMDR